MQNLEQEQQDAFNAMKKMAEKLSQVRQRSAKKFAEEICGQMKELNFLDSRFEIRISEAEKYSSNGKDEAEFYLSVNPGEPLKPLGSVASGGEISRVMLAVKTVLADEEDTYFNDHKDLVIYTPDAILKYKIFAAYRTDDRHILLYYNLGAEDYNRQAYLNDILNQRTMGAMLDQSAPVSTESKILTLSTCDRAGDAYRYVVQAYLVEKME